MKKAKAKQSLLYALFALIISILYTVVAMLLSEADLSRILTVIILLTIYALLLFGGNRLLSLIFKNQERTTKFTFVAPCLIIIGLLILSFLLGMISEVLQAITMFIQYPGIMSIEVFGLSDFIDSDIGLFVLYFVWDILFYALTLFVLRIDRDRTTGKIEWK